MAVNKFKTFVLDLVISLSTRYNRDIVSSLRAAFLLDDTEDYTIREIVLEAAESVSITGITKFFTISLDGDGITAAITKGANTITVSMKNMLVMTDAVNNLVLTNTNASGSNPVRLRAIYS
jgi:hypothetical protein